MSRYIVLQDVLEHLFRFNNVEKKLLNHVRIDDRFTVKNIIEKGLERNVLKEDDDRIHLVNTFEFILMLEELGIDTLKFCDYISWYEFENYIAKKLYEFGWEYILGYTHSRISRFQIDVIAIDPSLKRALIIECKHWRKFMGKNSLKKIVIDHILRVNKLIEYCEWVVVNVPKLRDVEIIVPIIVTLKRGSTKIIDGVPIVSLHYLNDFLANISDYLDMLRIKTFKNKCRA